MLYVTDLQTAGLRPVTFSLARGECVAVRGPSGAGKSLLLRAIADLDPNTGTVLLRGCDRNAIPAPQWRRRVGYVPAEPAWWAEDVGEHFSDWSVARGLVERLGLPDETRGWPVARLSSGERSRLGLVRALVMEPEVLLLDEPTAALDAAAASAVEALIAERIAKGLAILWVTHDATQAARIARRWLMVEAGQVREELAA